MQKYRLDLETLLEYLEEMHQNGILFTNVPPGFLGQKTGCQVRIDLVEGKVVYCHIEDSTGQVHVLSNSDNKAFSLLRGMGTLDWYVETDIPNGPSSLAAANSSLRPTPQMTTSPLPTLSPQNTPPVQRISSIVPRQVVNIESLVLQRLSRNQRRVLVLVDGTRSIEKIASVLYSSSQYNNIQGVLRTLRELESLGLITMAT
ncbi:MAG TPA: hypothetical protein VH593_31015 [Ktedonobacteraceae bacterium]|jgi:hypothetical protein